MYEHAGRSIETLQWHSIRNDAAATAAAAMFPIEPFAHFMHHLFTCVDNREHRCTSRRLLRIDEYTHIVDGSTDSMAMQSATGIPSCACVFSSLTVTLNHPKRIPFNENRTITHTCRP